MLIGDKERSERTKKIIADINREDENFEKIFKEVFYFFFLCPVDFSKAYQEQIKRNDKNRKLLLTNLKELREFIKKIK